MTEQALTGKPASKYFKCDPVLLCKNAGCCREEGSSPIVTPGDIIRIGDLTGKTPKEVWDRNGSVALFSYGHYPEFVYQVALSFIHEPCPFLGKNGIGCSIHENRPIMCEVFPYNLFLEGECEDHHGDFGCLKGTVPKPDHLELASKLMELVKKESLFVKDTLPFAYFGKAIHPIKDFPTLATKAFQIVREHDPDTEDPRSKAVMESIDQMISIRKGAGKTGSVELEDHLYFGLLVPVLHAIIRDSVSEFFGNLDDQTLSFYSNTAAERNKLRI